MTWADAAILCHVMMTEVEPGTFWHMQPTTVRTTGRRGPLKVNSAEFAAVFVLGTDSDRAEYMSIKDDSDRADFVDELIAALPTDWRAQRDAIWARERLEKKITRI